MTISYLRQGCVAITTVCRKVFKASFAGRSLCREAEISAGIRQMAPDPSGSFLRRRTSSRNRCSALGFQRIARHLDVLPRFWSNSCRASALRHRRQGRRAQLRDQPQDIGEQVLRNGHLRHLEDDVAGVAHDLRADLDQLLLERRQRPVLHGFQRRQSPQEVAEVRVSGLEGGTAAYLTPPCRVLISHEKLSSLFSKPYPVLKLGPIPRSFGRLFRHHHCLKRSRDMTLVHASTKSRTNFSRASLAA